MMMSIRRSSLLVFLVVVASLPVASGNPLYDERQWTGKNGSNLRAKYVGKVEGGAKVEIRDSNGKIHRIAVENLSEADRDFIKAGEAGKLPNGAEQAVTEAMKMFRPTPEMDRSKIPLIHGISEAHNDPVVKAFAPFLLWWDQEKLLPIPKGDDLESKAAWLHPRMARHFNTREASVSSVGSLQTGLKRYFNAEADDLATYHFGGAIDLSPEVLSKMAKGADATVLTMFLVQGSKQYTHAVTLLSAEPDGRVVFGCWGERFEGRIELLPDKDPFAHDVNRSPERSYSFKFENWDLAKAKAPEWIARHTPHFVLEYPHAKLLTLRLFVFAEPGKPAPPPNFP